MIDVERANSQYWKDMSVISFLKFLSFLTANKEQIDRLNAFYIVIFHFSKMVKVLQTIFLFI